MTTDSVSRLSWSTPPAALVTCAIGGLVLAGAAVLSNEAPARLLIGLAAAGLLAMAGLGLRQRPRLSIEPGDPAQLVVRGLTGPQRYSSRQITRARVVNYRRLGRRMPMLEIDVDNGGEEKLLIFGRWDLGASPDDVLDTLRAHL
ncbi:PH domain-containing protein [Nocardia huaxiensis]|uniref:PH domain-containing protein n=1 Tax=Nocardia huaxiensis TaxID=2755382 RepID=A0A7D6VEZ5_9NOCA|nr:PH domain-containing protein [Nocardia huaxiensis]QLY31075.1 PH domain-containing protein [Nocardia huaxiensis]UFS94601.1 PH domain-containing protein [Nocardia huaxiensis]